MTCNPNIRKAVYEKDLDTLYDLINNENGKDIWLNTKRLGNDKYSSRVKWYIDNMWVWEINGKITGCVAIIDEENGTKDVQVLTVHSAYQGQKIGTKLMDYAESFGGVIKVHVYETHGGVMDFYKKRGYTMGEGVLLTHWVPPECLVDPNTKAISFSKDMSKS